MTERITPQMVTNTTVNTIDNDLNQLEHTQEQLSTGYRINRPSDDPVGAAITLSLQGQISAYKQYQQNITQSVAMVQTQGASLQQILEVLQSAQELTVEAANGTMSPSDLGDAAQQILQYIGQVKQTADTQYDGNYVFSGSDVDRQPWNPELTDSNPAVNPDLYNGNLDSTSAGIGPGTQLQVSADLFDVLGNGTGPAGALNNPGASATPPTTSTATGGLLATLRTIYNDLTGSPPNQADLGNQLTNLQTNQNALLALQANVGATQDRLQMASSRISSLTSSDTIELGNIYDTDLAAATTSFSTEQAGYQAALQSTADIIQTSLLNFLQG